jgi:hypothetical protein
MFRQGDVMLVPVKEIPDGLVEVPRENGRIVLAHGEATGHAHVIEREREALFLAADLDEMTQRFLRIEEEHASVIDAWRCLNHSGETCWVPAYVEREQVDAARLSVVTREDVQGVVVEHDEHLPFVVTPGDYELRRQSEYAPEAPRMVAD